MSTQVQTRETRRVFFINGVQTFRITVQCVNKGPMPDTHLFLMEIVDEDDPQQDVFTRIVQLADLDSLNTDLDEPGYKSDRSAAIASGKSYWRADAFTKDYTDLALAEQADIAISDRLNALVTDFSTFDASFKTSPEEDKYYPSADQSTIDALKAAYETAYDTYVAAQTAQVAADTALTTSEATLVTAQTALDDWSSLQEAMQASLTYLTNAQAALSSLAATEGKNFLTDADKFIEDYKDFFPKYQKRAIELTLDSAGYVDLTVDDVGAIVSDTPGGGTSSGTLIAFDNDAHTWLITPDEPYDDNEFGVANYIDLTSRLGSSWLMTQPGVIVVDSGEGPNLPFFEASRNRFATARLEGEINATTAASGVTEMTAAKNEVTSQVNTKTAEVAAAQSAVTTAQANASKADADVATAYDALASAYNAVKAACSGWSPDPPFPPLPST